jgi:hypothetical protein
MANKGTYDTPQTEVYMQPSAAFGATTDSQKLIGPKGKRGLVRDVLVHITADMVGTTTVPEIAVGASSGTNEYARYRLGTSATAGYTAASSPKRASQEAITGNPPRTLSDYAGHVALEKTFIPADTAFFITRVAGVGGTPAGTGPTWVVVDWF